MADHPPPAPVRHGMSLRARHDMSSPYARPSQGRPARKSSARKARLEQPQSHYKNLSGEQKRIIRPFVFLKLPAELRLEIYKLILLVPAFVVDPNDARSRTFDLRRNHSPGRASNLIEGRLIIAYKRYEIETLQQRHLQLQILQCCRQLNNEGRDYFWNQNEIEQLNDLIPFRGSHPLDSAWPQVGMHLPSIRTLRVRIGVPNLIEGLFSFRCNCLDKMPNLKTLQVACVFFRNAGVGNWALDGRSQKWRECLVLGGIVRQIVQHTPSSVTLKWGLWESALADDSVKFATITSVHTSILEKVANSYKRERGRKSRPAVKKEAGD
ncbi:hypothetical protein E6O75_ATG10384 [Venturia nashicola]|uniref:Uncharacterized protein n=1 Tax=Venturia nashicola TaxID=86259 RepID=A0A4Z1P0W4_9PEZI|nr:hypothetical protein E6O75_ATG10384 [Venturia nashicola]